MIRRSASLLCTLSLAAAAPSGPGEVAVAYLQQVRDDEINIGTRTALSPDTTKEKRQKIREHLDRLGERLRHGELRVMAKKVEGELAAALVSQVSEFNPSSAQIHAIGLVQRDGSWQPAPVVASFENTGLSYHPKLGPAARRLEAWMLDQRPARLSRLRAELDEQLISEVRRSKARDLIPQADPEALVEGFLEACRNRDLPATLAFLGGLEDPLPEEWRELVPLVATGLRLSGDAKQAWITILDPHSLQAILKTETRDDDAVVTLGIFNPITARLGREKVELRQFAFSRTTPGSWHLRMPDWLVTNEGWTEDLDLEDTFARMLLDKLKTKPAANPIDLGESMMRGLLAPDMRTLCGLISIADEEDTNQTLFSYGRLWRQYRSSTHLGIMLDAKAAGDQACGVYCELDPYNPEIRQDRIFPILMIRSDGGWRLGEEAAPEASDLPHTLRPWFDECLERDRGQWLHSLGLDEQLGGLPADSAPEADEARRLAERWSGALQSRDPRRILEHTTIFDDERSIRRLFAFLGQELPNRSTLEILGMHHHGRWAAASIRHQPPADSDDPPTDLLHPIVGTANGPKVLPEAVLYVADNRARSFLNREAWKRLEQRLPEEAVDELRTILKAHQELCQPADAPAE